MTKTKSQGLVIGFDASRAFVAGRTGTENYSFQLLKHLSLIDTENRYLIYIRAGVDRTKLNRNDGSNKTNNFGWPENFEFVEIGLPRLWTQLGLAFRTFVDPIDVLFVPSHTLPLIRRPGLKTVITVHDLGAEFLPAFHQLKQLLYLNLMTHYQLKTATKIIAVSEATKEDIVFWVKGKGRSIKGKIDVVYEGVDKSVFKRMSNDIVSDIVKKYDLVRGKYFLFVGTVQPRKNLERLIKAFNDFQKDNTPSLQESEGLRNQKTRKPENQKLKSDKSDSLNFRSLSHSEFSEYKLVLVGSKGWKSDEIYELPRKLGLEDSVKFLGRISDSELVGLYNGAVALTYPSLFEGFGLPIVEAFACGTAVITSDVSSMPEVAGGAAILVDPYNIEEIARAMEKVVFEEKNRSSMIQKGIIRAGKFDWGKAAGETLKVIVSAMKG